MRIAPAHLVACPSCGEPNAFWETLQPVGLVSAVQLSSALILSGSSCLAWRKETTIVRCRGQEGI